MSDTNASGLIFKLWLTGAFAAYAPQDRALAWHHLVMAAGNFKRQTPIFTFGIGGSAAADRPASHRRLTFEEGTGTTLECETREPWATLRGAGIDIATATTLLAALWPHRHAIMDDRTRRCSVALIGHSQNWERVPLTNPDSTDEVVSESWDTYHWYRTAMLSWRRTAGDPRNNGPIDWNADCSSLQAIPCSGTRS